MIKILVIIFVIFSIVDVLAVFQIKGDKYDIKK